MQNNNFELTILGSGYWLVIIILSVLLILIVRSNPFLIGKNKIKLARKRKWGIIIGFSLISFFFLDEITWLTAKTIIIIDQKKMTVTKVFWGVSFVKNYDISKISNLRVDHNVGGSWNMSRWDNGMPLATDPTVLYFDYDGTTESIGKHLNNFPADSIINAVKKEAK
jgi:hypothetical protein